jgi:hypothetical protein
MNHPGCNRESDRRQGIEFKVDQEREKVSDVQSRYQADSMPVPRQPPSLHFLDISKDLKVMIEEANLEEIT